LRLLCSSSCSFLVNSFKFWGLLSCGFLFMWCTSKLLARCFCPVLADLKPLRSISSRFSSSDNKLICSPPRLGSGIIAPKQVLSRYISSNRIGVCHDILSDKKSIASAKYSYRASFYSGGHSGAFGGGCPHLSLTPLIFWRRSFM
jgi:hypothetical protein